jgi:ribulose-5-phosphate 4-epimerase/fuculose-1-phosphate aldolase
MISEAQARIELAACYRLAARAGWEELVSTHISARVPGSTDILMNPFGLMFDEVTASSLVRVDAQGRVVSDPTGLGFNPGGFITHSQLHSARADAECVVHLHPQAAVALSCRQEGLLPITDDAAVIVSELGYHSYEDGPTHLAKPEGLLQSFVGKYYLIQRSHGVFTIGESIGQAWLRMYALVRACEVQIMAQSNRSVVDHVPAPSLADEEIARRRAKAARVGALGWTALLRRLAREEPNYRD